ncbi:class F sortase [Streptomyces ipomoeae]|uniref:Class F sortase n=1 Tax=Streptomyces ipomoeae TaxID=103232 RepID=A0A540QLX4_9ACTN|nr:class F sortase [Streptomyces ipomoeae]TQE36278.1 class F sortase [Streptomyces ipomoeae]TQE36490.1 class F sortase [Streptomyces ipomoeae]
MALVVMAVSLFGHADSASDATRPLGARHVPQVDHDSAPAPLAGRPTGKHLPRSKPVRLLIPKIAVDAPFTALAIGDSGQLEAPPADDVNLVGWHAAGASPGEIGTSIIAGHVDTETSPAVFAKLSNLKKGDVFHVVRADGRKATFVVDEAETFEKDNFPDRRVYADAPRAEVRLITCAGPYDHTAKDYTENLVVFAHLQ